MSIDASHSSPRLLSLDVLRGIIMLLLAAESCTLYEAVNHQAPGWLIYQFFHHPWHGLRFWDLVQPAFMTMAGAAMYIAYQAKISRGISWQQNFWHILIRCVKLFIFGTALHCVYAGKLVWELWNVLTQLSVTTLIAYSIIRRSVVFQILFSICLLLLTEVLYRTVLMPGFDKPFTQFESFGNWVDLKLMGKINTDGWVAINIIPTAAHTIWGVLAGRLLVSKATAASKIKYLVLAGIAALAAGLVLNGLAITPIIKRIATSSFTLAAGGWVLLWMALLYWITDVKQYKQYAWIFVVVGMNAIFIYLFFETVGVQWLNKTIAIFVKGFVGYTGLAEGWLNIITAIVSLWVEWHICYWLYKKKIFFKL
ncbi:MAG: hypothetical protein RL172_2675 [Bacteroidota bacterium]|jgi:predicted acyltransferase